MSKSDIGERFQGSPVNEDVGVLTDCMVGAVGGPFNDRTLKPRPSSTRQGRLARKRITFLVTRVRYGPSSLPGLRSVGLWKEIQERSG